MSDREIIQLLRADPSQGLYEAIQQYHRLVHTIISRILPNNPQDVEECVEDAFLNVWRRIEHVDPDASLKAYLLRTARNVAINRYRVLKRANVVSLEVVSDGGGEPSNDEDMLGTILSADASRELEELIRELEQPDRDIFFRKYFLFESRKQIAEKVGLDEIQVKNKLHRVKQKLRKRLEERGISYEAV